MQRPLRSLEEVNASVDTVKKIGFGKKLLAFIGPAYLVSVGYMDPGNWATDIAGGSKFGYSLVWVLVMSNLMALLLQSLSARLGIVRGQDLAQASRAAFPPAVNISLWLLAEIAIAACDLAEVIGMAIGLQLLFGLNLLVGVCITIADTFLLFFLMKFGIRKMEAFIIGLIGTIGLAFIAQMVLAKPSLGAIASGIIPRIPGEEALYIAIGIIGATVMPHNLYLHSSLVQTRKFERSSKGIRSAIRFNVFDTTFALNLALFVNAAILILAASALNGNGYTKVTELENAHQLLRKILGSSSPVLFAIALIAAGQSSTLTGTLSGQIVMEGYLNIRLQPWLRRLITRLIAIIPALLTILFKGESSINSLLILSQVVLSLQLGFAIIPLVHFVSDKKTMGEFAIKPLAKIAAWVTTIVIITLNVKMLSDAFSEWMAATEHKLLLATVLTIISVSAGALLLYVTVIPLARQLRQAGEGPHGISRSLNIAGLKKYDRIAIAVDFSGTDSSAISHSLSQGGKNAHYVLIHIVETAGARLYDNDTDDRETQSDLLQLEKYAEEIRAQGYNVDHSLGFGDPKKEIAILAKEFDAELLVMAAHGHTGLKDILFGTTLDAVRHNVSIPVLIVNR
ncbi:MAG TPA: Nramp family divalent metal transporter [Bacteroidia bacterium]|jgi:manganese transport protein